MVVTVIGLTRAQPSVLALSRRHNLSNLLPLLGGLGGAGLLAAWLGHGTGCFTTVAELPSKLATRVTLSNGLLGVGVPTRRAGEAASAASTAETLTALSSVQRLVGGDTRRVKAAMDP